MTLRVVGGEVALVDVLALETIRVFAPAAYAELSASIGTLTGRRQVYGEDSRARDAIDAPRVAAIVDAAAPHEDAVKEILGRLFPKIGQLVGGTRTSGGEQTARRELRVADPDILRTYLERTLPPGVVSGVLVGEAAAALSDPSRLEGLFADLDPDLAEALIQRLEDYEHEYDPAVVEPALPVLLNQLSRLREGRSRGMFDYGADIVVGRVVLRLMRRIDDEAERLAIVERCLPRVRALNGRKELIDTVGHRENVGHRLIPESDSQRLYAELYEQIAVAESEQLVAERGLIDLFVRMSQDDEEKAKTIVRELCRDDRVFLAVLRSGLGERRAQAVGDYAVRRRASLPWEAFEEWLGADLLRERLREVADESERASLDERTRLALETAESYAAGELNNDHRDL